MPSSDRTSLPPGGVPWLKALKASLQPLPPRPDTRRVIPSVPSPEGGQAVSYARFIPREELGEVRPWSLSAFGADAAVPAPGRAAAAGPGTKAAEEAPTAEQWQARIEQAREDARKEARQHAYEEGYRDGLAALEGFKKSHVQEVSARLGDLLRHFDSALTALEGQMAGALAGTAVQLARQVVRQELATRPEHVIGVAQESVQAVLMSARQIVLRVHPDDLELVRTGAGDVLQARGARLVGDAQVARGGCLVESDAGAIDASIATRWTQAAAGLGQPTPWTSEPDGAGAVTPGRDAP